MRYNAANHAMMLPSEARGIGMVSPRPKPGRVPAEVKLARMMRNPNRKVAASPRTRRVAERVMRHSGLASPIVQHVATKAERMATMSDEQIRWLAQHA